MIPIFRYSGSYTCFVYQRGALPENTTTLKPICAVLAATVHTNHAKEPSLAWPALEDKLLELRKPYRLLNAEMIVLQVSTIISQCIRERLLTVTAKDFLLSLFSSVNQTNDFFNFRWTTKQWWWLWALPSWNLARQWIRSSVRPMPARNHDPELRRFIRRSMLPTRLSTWYLHFPKTLIQIIPTPKLSFIKLRIDFETILWNIKYFDNGILIFWTYGILSNPIPIVEY